jgi:tetratricopeptide (TPR) repeat protein
VIAREVAAMASIPGWAASWRTLTLQSVGRSYHRLNRPVEAIDRYERSLTTSVDPYERALARARLVLLYDRVGQRTRAREHAWAFAQIVDGDLDPSRLAWDRLHVAGVMASCAIEDGEDDVEAHVRTIMSIGEQHPDDVELRLICSLGLAELVLNRHDPAAALTLLERDLPVMREAQREGRLPITIHPAFLHLLLAEAQARSRQAVTPLQPALSYGPERSGPGVFGPDWLVLIAEDRAHGFVDLAAGKYDAAAAAFQQGIERARSIHHPALESNLAYHQALAFHREGLDARDEIALARQLAEALGQTGRLRDLDAASD